MRNAAVVHRARQNCVGIKSLTAAIIVQRKAPTAWMRQGLSAYVIELLLLSVDVESRCVMVDSRPPTIVFFKNTSVAPVHGYGFTIHFTGADKITC